MPRARGPAVESSLRKENLEAVTAGAGDQLPKVSLRSDNSSREKKILTYGYCEKEI